jgi:hypothetical protein
MEAAQWIAGVIADEDIFSEEALALWTLTAVNTVTWLRGRIALEPFAKTTDFDSYRFVKRLTVGETIQVVLLGKGVTAFDRCSLRYSYGIRVGGLLSRVAARSGALRARMYRAMRKIFNF